MIFTKLESNVLDPFNRRECEFSNLIKKKTEELKHTQKQAVIVELEQNLNKMRQQQKEEIATLKANK